MCTSVASRVQGTTGEPCSSWPWWLRMMCSTATASSAGKPGRSSISAAHAVVAERDLALELAQVGHVDRQRVGRVGVQLADVVQQRAGDRDVAVHAAERGARSRDTHCATVRRVLEQPVAVGLVVALGRRRLAEQLPRLGARRRTRGPAARAGGGTGPSRSARAGRPPCARPGSAGRRAGRRARTRPASAGAQRVHRRARPRGSTRPVDAHARRRARRPRAAPPRACRCDRRARAAAARSRAPSGPGRSPARG